MQKSSLIRTLKLRRMWREHMNEEESMPGYATDVRGLIKQPGLVCRDRHACAGRREHGDFRVVMPSCCRRAYHEPTASLCGRELRRGTDKAAMAISIV